MSKVQMTRDEFLDEMAEVFISGFVVRFRMEDDWGKNPQVFADKNLHRMRRVGIYGWCESTTKECDYGSAIDWPWKVLPMHPGDVHKFAGVVEFKLKEVLEGIREAKYSDGQSLLIMDDFSNIEIVNK